MKLDQDSIPILQSYLIRTLEPICVAEPAVLSNYVLSLLQNDKSRPELQAFIEEELNVFLKEGLETTAFSQKLFSVLKEDPRSDRVIFKDDSQASSSSDGRYSQSNHSSSHFNSSNSSHSTIPTYNPDSDKDMDRDYKHRRDDNDFRRRREEEPFEDDYQQRKRRKDDDIASGNGDRHNRGDRRHNDMDDRPRGSRQDRYNERPDRHHNNSNRDAENPRKGRNDRPFKERPRQRCRDYDEKGYCVRGDQCHFDHGNDRIVVSDVPDVLKRTDGSDDRRKDVIRPLVPFPMNAIPSFLPGAPMHELFDQMIPKSEEDDAIQVGGKGMYGYNKPGRFDGGNNDRDRGSRDRRPPRFEKTPQQFQGSNNGGNSSNGNSSTSNAASTTLALSNVPPEFNTIDQLNAHFKKFGTVTNIQVKPDYSKAFVQFSTNEGANAALNAPDAVFGNRFIRIYWAKRQNPTDKTAAANSTNPPAYKKPPASDPAKIAEAAKASMELANAHKEKKKEEEKEREKRVREISKQKEDLRRTQLEHTKILLEQLSKAKLDPKERENLMRKVQSVTEDVASSIAKDSSSLATKQQEKAIPMAPIVPAKHSTPKKDWVNKEDKEREMLDRELEMMSQKKADVGSDEAESEASRVERLQKRYDSLQKIAANMGISETGSPTASARPPKRPAHIPGPHTGAPNKKRAMTLDNRPTTLALIKIPDDVTDDELTRHFQTFGEVKSFNRFGSDKSAALIHFGDRRSAETALAKGKAFKSHNLMMTWNNVNSTTKTATGTQNQPQANSNDNEESIVEEVYRGRDANEDNYSDEETQEERSWKR